MGLTAVEIAGLSMVCLLVLMTLAIIAIAMHARLQQITEEILDDDA